MAILLGFLLHLAIVAEVPDAAVPTARQEPMSALTAGPNGKAIPERQLSSMWWCRGMVCVSRLPAEGDVCAELTAVNRGPCRGQEKAYVLRATDLQQQAEVILVLSSASICARQLRRWKRDANLGNPVCEVVTPAAFFGLDVSATGTD